MRSSDQLEKLAESLALANAKLKNPKHNAKVMAAKAGSYTHADMVSITDELRPVFASEGISFIQSVSDNYIHTRMLHVSGQWIETSYPFYCNATDAKLIGAWTTYMRKYAISMTAFIYGDKEPDNDSRDSNDNELSLGNQDFPKQSQNGSFVKKEEPVISNSGVEITKDQIDGWKVDYDVREGTDIYNFLHKMSLDKQKSIDFLCAHAMKNQERFNKSFQEYSSNLKKA